VECGLGGKSDATNVIDNNLLTVLTSISLDHTALLGATVEEIAKEKCGIIKPGTEVVSAEQDKSAEIVIGQCCGDVGVNCRFTDKSAIEYTGYSDGYQRMNYRNYNNIELGMLGDYQLENAALALECTDALKKKGYRIDKNAIYKGMKDARWGGRFEIVNRNPFVILDGAHNPDAAQRLKNSLELYFKDKELLFIIGVFADKDYDGILKITAPLAKKIFAIKAPSERGLDTALLAKATERYNENVVASKLNEAVDYCLTQTDCVTVAFGSLSFMGEITEYIKKHQKEYKEQ
jgi:dihydrofolate synthase/folylpolyglutamate synthase